MSYEIRQGDALDLARAQGDATVDCLVTSPPYWGLRDYGVDGQLGLEPHPAQYLEALWAHADEWWRLLKDTGTLWVNLGDTYFGGGQGGGDKNQWGGGTGKYGHSKAKSDGLWLRPKQLLLIPSRFAIGMQERGWLLRNDVVWHKPNAMPSSAEDRFTCAYEHVFYFVKQERAFFNMEDSLEAYSTPLNRFGGEDMESESEWDEGTGQSTLRSRPARPNDSGRHPRDVFTIPTTGSHIPHYAMMPQELARKLVVAGTPPKVCGECGKPWEREVDATSDWERRKAAGEPIRHGLARAAASGAGGFVMPTRTPGPWHPACTCDAGTVPGLVLDPFCGAGTTGIVARRLGFRFLGFELDAEMVAVARSRIARAHVKEKRPPKQPDPQVQGSLL